MNAQFGSLADEFYTSTRLYMKLDLHLERTTVLHFFEQVKKAFPRMKRFRRRDDGCLILEEVSEDRSRRSWLRLDPAGLRFGHYAPQSEADLQRLADVVLECAPVYLSLSELDFDHMEVVYGFDLEYRGNHDQLVAETLWSDHPLAGFLLDDRASHIIDAQPYVGIALTQDCDVQAYAEIKSRTNSYEVRTGDYEPQPLSVYLTIRKYWGVGDNPNDTGLVETHHRMREMADNLAADKVVPILVNPLAQAIASRS